MLLVGKVTASSPLLREASPRSPSAGRQVPGSPSWDGGVSLRLPPPLSLPVLLGSPRSAHPTDAVPPCLGLGSTFSPPLPPASAPWALHDQLEPSRTSPENSSAPGNFCDYTVPRRFSRDYCVLAFIVSFKVGIWGRVEAEDETWKGWYWGQGDLNRWASLYAWRVSTFLCPGRVVLLRCEDERRLLAECSVHKY